jgi:phage/conjugal plasmid C-4 type zinc finger TraR family protein
MAGGWTKDGAIHDNIEAHIEQAVRKARGRTAAGRESLTHCERCGEPIPEARRKAVPGVRMCVRCQEADERTR